MAKTAAAPKQKAKKKKEEGAAAKLKVRRVNQCRKCRVPIKGHDCPHKKSKKKKNQKLLLVSKETAAVRPKHKHKQTTTTATPRGTKKRPRRDHAKEGDSNYDVATEVIMAAHIFTDELQEYKQDNAATLTDGERLFLKSWSRLAQDVFTNQDELVAVNIKLVQQRKELGKQVNKERDAIVGLRSKIRNMQAASHKLEQQLAADKQTCFSKRAASRFLDAMDRLQT